ncbi:hypothetical protein [Actinophytocola sp.]|uniref:hypothetical protein n=1 Tax=Actinophytocola sp. TaxID=1872138 RepID=UPI003D6BD222
MADTREAAVAVLEQLQKMVDRDGGQLTLREVDDTRSRVVVEYRLVENPDCATCTISTDMIASFLAESLTARGVTSPDVEVVNPE